MLRLFLFACLAACPFLSTYADERNDALWQAYQQKKGTYPLSTQSLDEAGRPKHLNPLILENAPYLLQHAHHPIHWQAWTKQTLAAALRENRLIFLSIGYSTCHWCHVMAQESFENEEIAQLLNAHYVSIKVDREEHPELDEYFLAALELLTSSPGWPMTLILTPDGKPVAGDSYLPAEKLSVLLTGFARAWQERPQQVLRQAALLEERLKPSVQALHPDIDALYMKTLSQLRARYDTTHHGFGSAPKFPEAASLSFLLDAYQRQGGKDDRRKFLDTLQAMALSALHDPVDGGFHRYSVTGDWQTPHYEKMLYDQARLLSLFAEAWALTGDKSFNWLSKHTIEFVNSRMLAENGLFLSALDAGNGDFYTWDEKDLVENFDADDRHLIARHYRRAAQKGGRFILLPNLTPPSPAMERITGKLAKLRQQRPTPFVDKKSISAWNAIMIEAMAQAGSKLGNPDYARAAVAGMKALLKRNVRNGHILRYSSDGAPTLPGSLEDTASILHALAILHEVDNNPYWLGEASHVMESLPDDATLAQQFRLFTLDRHGPSAAATLLDALDRLFRQSGERRYKDKLETLSSLAYPMLDPAHDQASLIRQLYQLRHPAPQHKAYLAHGHIRVEITSLVASDAEMEFELAIRIEPGWHINSHQPLQDYLRPTRISGNDAPLLRVTYPEAKKVRLGISNELLSVYEGTVKIRGSASTAEPFFLLLDIQACNDQSCLPPESARLIAYANTRPS